MANSIKKRYAMVTLGATICGASIDAFYVPNGMLSGGLSGISMILYYLFNFPIGITSIIFNIPLFFFAYRLMDKNYMLLSLYGMFIFSFSIDGFLFLAKLNLTNDLLIAALCGGLGNGIGAGIMYRANGGSGGTDTIGAILNKFYGVSIGSVGLALNTMVTIANIFLFGIQPAVYTFISMYISAFTTDKTTAGFDNKKSLFIISSKYYEITEDIFKEVGRGATFLFAEGAYTHKQSKIVFVVIKLTQIAKIKSIVQKHDPQAFMIIQEATEVMGKGFTLKSDQQLQKEFALQKKKDRLKNIARIHRQRHQKLLDEQINHFDKDFPFKGE